MTFKQLKRRVRVTVMGVVFFVYYLWAKSDIEKDVP